MSETTEIEETVNLPALLTVAEVAEYLGIATGTLYYWRCRGDRGPRSIKVEGTIRYRASDVREWSEENQN